ncbi:MAG: virulence-associated E family protein [Polyangiaceae bacterium]
MTTEKKKDVLQLVPSTAREAGAKKVPTWSSLLLTNREGVPKKNLANTMVVFAAHPDWSGVLAYDAFAETVVCVKAPPTRPTDAVADRVLGDWSEEDGTRTAAWFSSVIGFDPPTDMVHAAATAISHRRRVHPVVDYLRGLKWDKSPRLDSLLSRYFGTANTEYTQAVGSRWMISAVARVMRPGCQSDCMLVIEGKQGRRKSTGLEALVGAQWFADTPLAIGDKDAFQSLRRKWVIEIAELDAFKNREATKIKAFISARTDNYRQSYARKNRDFPRQCVFAGSTNESEYLTDRTGNRRFWPVQSTRMIDVDAIRRDRDQLWAEAHERFLAGEPWHVDTQELRKLCESEQEARTPVDAWMATVAKWLDEPTRWNQLEQNGITTTEVLRHAIGLEVARIGRAEETRAGLVLRDCGWKSRQLTENKVRIRRYFPAQPSDENGHVVQEGCADETA